jgi:MarR family transcriptional regulator, organic hydroperoxide resistance regulator
VEASDGKRREELGDEIAALLSPLARELRAAFVSCAGELGLAPGEAQALWLLAARGAVSTTELARALTVDPANASTLITKLERRGLVAREAAASDRRKRLASLTPDGRRMRKRLSACMGRRKPTFGRLTTEELVNFRDLLRRLEA